MTKIDKVDEKYIHEAARLLGERAAITYEKKIDRMWFSHRKNCPVKDTKIDSLGCPCFWDTRYGDYD